MLLLLLLLLVMKMMVMMTAATATHSSQHLMLALHTATYTVCFAELCKVARASKMPFSAVAVSIWVLRTSSSACGASSLTKSKAWAMKEAMLSGNTLSVNPDCTANKVTTCSSRDAGLPGCCSKAASSRWLLASSLAVLASVDAENLRASSACTRLSRILLAKLSRALGYARFPIRVMLRRELGRYAAPLLLGLERGGSSTSCPSAMLMYSSTSSVAISPSASWLSWEACSSAIFFSRAALILAFCSSLSVWYLSMSIRLAWPVAGEPGTTIRALREPPPRLRLILAARKKRVEKKPRLCATAPLISMPS
mmetsp:Transcript_28633/g.77233  ORF Transcript_28633/g.77233 Transcript_28633/m.77233 type:complete len:310 (-) Transcript_28633:1183-2112(-)